MPQATQLPPWAPPRPARVSGAAQVLLMVALCSTVHDGLTCTHWCMSSVFQIRWLKIRQAVLSMRDLSTPGPLATLRAMIELRQDAQRRIDAGEIVTKKEVSASIVPCMSPHHTVAQNIAPTHSCPLLPPHRLGTRQLRSLRNGIALSNALSHTHTCITNLPLLLSNCVLAADTNCTTLATALAPCDSRHAGCSVGHCQGA